MKNKQNHQTAQEETLAINFNKITSNIVISKKEVELIINYIISDKGGIDLKEITPEKSIGNDLGID